MDEAQVVKTPVHLWVVGLLSLIWNAFGGYDYIMTRTRNTDYLASMMPGIDPNATLAWIDSFPIWAQIGWGLGVWGGVIGSILLLMRNRYAVVAFGLSLLGALMSLGWQLAGGGEGAPAGMNEGAAAVMPWVIILIAIALLYYAHSQRRKGVLR